MLFLNKFFRIVFSAIFLFSFSQYQQCTHLKGNTKANSPAIFGIQGEYHKDNTIGGLAYSTSFLLENTNEIILFFGYQHGEEIYWNMNNNVWKYSTKLNQWMFVKGDKEIPNLGPEPNDLSYNVEKEKFIKELKIGSRSGVKGWINEIDGHYIVSFFGGKAYIAKFSPTFEYSPDLFDCTNEFWKYNVSSQQYSLMHFNSFSMGMYNNIFATDTYPGGRNSHEIIKLNEDSVLLVGGIGYVHESVLSSESETENLGDWWIYSNSKNEWKFGKYDTISQRHTASSYNKMQFNEINVYHEDNRINGIIGHSGVLINSEEVLIFGGTETLFYRNIIAKYNITGNTWKYVNGNYSMYLEPVLARGYIKEFNATNYIGPRINFGIWKVKNDELLIFGGLGFQESDSIISGIRYLSDEWRYNLESDLWKYSGLDYSKIGDRVMQNGDDDMNVIFGGMQSFVGEFVEETNTLYIISGLGKDFVGLGWLNDVFSVYLGAKCDSIQSNDPNVCSGHGKCVSYQICECDSGFDGEFCENDILNETLNNYLWIFIILPICFLVVIVLFTIIISFSLIIFFKWKKTKNKFKGIEDVDLILQEAKLEQSSTKPKIQINKSLFEIEYKDLHLVSLLGSGGQSSVYLAEWKGNFCAYKGFKVHLSSSTTEVDSFSYVDFENEVKIYSSIHHPSILRFYGACISPPNIGIVLEFCKNGDLNSHLNKYKYVNKKSYPISGKIRLLKEVASGLMYLHSINVLHRDLKPENVLIDDKENSKIMDFGLSRFLDTSFADNTMTKEIGTSFYMAPEVFLGGKYSNKCDVFSFAILCYVVITENFLPYGISNQFSILRKVSSSNQFRPNIASENFKDCAFLMDLIKKNWNGNPEERNSFEEIVKILKNEEKKYKDEKKEEIEKKSTSSNKENKDKIIMNQKNEIEVLQKKLKEANELIKSLQEKNTE